MQYRRMASFNYGNFGPTNPEITWDIFVEVDGANYAAHAVCVNDIEQDWVDTGYATPDGALVSMNNHVINYIKLQPPQVPSFIVVCYPDTPQRIVLAVTCTNTTWDIQIAIGTGIPKSGTGNNYGDTVTNMWNAVMTY